MKLVYGVGVNDADYVVHLTEELTRVDGKRKCKLVWICPFYQTWKNMLARCINEKYQDRYPTYIGCTVCEEWLTFSNFRKWMEQQDWEGKELDKDLLFIANKIYSPDTCVFVDKVTNGFTLGSGATRGKWPIGVSFHERSGKFQANCENPFTKKKEYLGLFICPNEGHLAWKKRKHELALQLADLQSDKRVAKVLRERYTPDKDWSNK